MTSDASSSLPPMDSPARAVPLTEAQEGLWYAQRLDPRNPIFNTGHCTDIHGTVDIERLAIAIEHTLREADALSLAFLDTADGPRQYFDAARRPRLERLTLPDSPAGRAEASRRMQEDLRTAIDPTAMPLARYILIQFSAQPGTQSAGAGVLWYQRVHHLAADGYGMALIEQRAMQHYEALAGTAGSGRPLTSFAAVVADDAHYRTSSQRQADAAFWKEQLAPLDGISSLAERSLATADHALHAEINVPETLLQTLRQRAQQTLVSWPDILTLFLAAYVQRHIGQQPVVPGVPWMGRLGNASARSVATVMNIVPLVLELDQDRPLDTLLIEGARKLKSARRHGRYRSEQMRRDLGRPGGQGRIHGPLLNILPFDAPYRQVGLDASQTVFSTGPVEDFNINVRATPDAGGMRLQIEANPRLYTAEEIRLHPPRLLAFLQAALSAETLRPVQTLHGQELKHWTQQVNDTAHPVPDTTLVALVQDACLAHRTREALRMQDEHLDFAAFDTQVKRAARQLVQMGVRPRDIVAVALPRSPRMVMTLHAIQRAGAAYLPLDIEQPAARIQRILTAARPSATVVTKETGALLVDDAATTPVDVEHLFAREAPSRSSGTAAPLADTLAAIELPAVQPADPAYVIYTSGSTGDPKGVVISHRAIVNRLLWMRAHYDFGPAHRFLQKTPYTFDVSVWELFLPMLCGAALVVAEPGLHRDPQALASLIRREAVDVAHFVPSMLSAFLDEPLSQGLQMTAVFCSGEALPATLRDRFHARISSALHNLYGPTEAAVDVSAWPADRDDRSDPVPIGFPVWNTGLHILDECLRPVPPGVTGTLYLSGRQLADGYLGRPDLTAARFITHPGFCTDAARPNPETAPAMPLRLYDSGDLARWRPDGAVEYRGRLDHQVKLRGQRIELGEIEAALGTHPRCRQVAVLARSDHANSQHLVAYVVPQPGAERQPAGTNTPSSGRACADGQIAASGSQPTDSSVRLIHDDPLAGELLDHARALLPAAMVPSVVILLSTLPIGSSGKLDRKALPAPVFAAHGRTPARSPLEKQVATTFADILGLPEPPGLEDDFFALGGHSLLATRLAARLRDMTGAELTLGAVFEHPEVGHLAAWIERLLRRNVDAQAAGFGPIFRLRGDIQLSADRMAAPPSGSAQRQQPARSADCHQQPPALFCIHPAGGLAWCYGLLARRLAGDRPVIGIQSPALSNEHSRFENLRTLAAHYADLLQQLQPEGPYHLLGWSTGGILVQEIACQLKARQSRVGVACLLDAYPADAWRDRAPAETHDVWRAILHIAGQDPDALAAQGPLTRERVIGFLRANKHPLGELTDTQLHGIFEAVSNSNQLVKAHHHQRYDGELLYFRAALDHAGESLHPWMWQPWAAHLTVHDVPSLHAHMPGEVALHTWLPKLEAALAKQDDLEQSCCRN